MRDKQAGASHLLISFFISAFLILWFAVARVHRHGQTRTVLQLTFVTVSDAFVTAEQSKMGVALGKKRMEAKVIGTGDFDGLAGDDVSRRDTLMQLYNQDQNEETETRTRGITMDELDVMISRDEDELAFYRTLRNVEMRTLLTRAELPRWVTEPRRELERGDRGASNGRKRVRVNYADYGSSEDDDGQAEMRDSGSPPPERSAAAWQEPVAPALPIQQQPQLIVKRVKIKLPTTAPPPPPMPMPLLQPQPALVQDDQLQAWMPMLPPVPPLMAAPGESAEDTAMFDFLPLVGGDEFLDMDVPDIFN
jgi:hypothetical protein